MLHLDAVALEHGVGDLLEERWGQQRPALLRDPLRLLRGSGAVDARLVREESAGSSSSDGSKRRLRTSIICAVHSLVPQ